MKIKKFNESELQGPDGIIDIVNNMSQTKAEEIIKILRNQESINKNNLIELESIEKELSKFKSDKKNSNTQIDDSILEIQNVVGSIKKDILPSIDTILNRLQDYINNGTSFIYEK